MPVFLLMFRISLHRARSARQRMQGAPARDGIATNVDRNCALPGLVS
jgi:hypothetical protein